MTLQTKHKILIASFAFRLVRYGRRIQGKSLQGRFKRSSFNWELDLREVIDFMIYLSGSFEASLGRFIRNNVEEGGVAMDIGANIGAHTLQMARNVGASGKVYAVEATAYAHAKLLTNIGLNPTIKDRVDAIHCLIESGAPQSEGMAAETLIHSSWPFETETERHPSHQGVFKSVGEAQRSSLDALVAAKNITRLDLVKLDVDGHEWDVLSGGVQTLETMRPAILMEVAPDYHDPSDTRGFYNIHNFLTRLGYRFYDFKGKQLPEVAEELAATIPGGASINVVALTKDSGPIRFNR